MDGHMMGQFFQVDNSQLHIVIAKEDMGSRGFPDTQVSLYAYGSLAAEAADGQMVKWSNVSGGKGLITGIHYQHLEGRLAAAVNAIQQDQQGCFSIAGRDNSADPYLIRNECH